MKTRNWILGLAILAACSTFASQRVTQYAMAIEQGADTVAQLVTDEAITPDQADGALAVLRVAQNRLEAYWAAVKSGKDSTTLAKILDSVGVALDEFQAYLRKVKA